MKNLPYPIPRLWEILHLLFSKKENGGHRGMTLFFALMSTFLVAFRILQSYATGHIPTVQTVSLLWLYEWRLPFTVSRLWDVGLIPVLAFAFAFICTTPYDSRQQNTTDKIGTIITLNLLASAIVGLVLGLPYAVVAFLVIAVSSIIALTAI